MASRSTDSETMRGPSRAARSDLSSTPAMPSLLTTVTAPIVYRVSMPEPEHHEFEIQMDVPALPDGHVVEVVFPAWAPGSYMVRDFVRHVYRLTFTGAGGRSLEHERIDKQRWRVTTH